MPRRLLPTRVLSWVDRVDAKYGSIIQLIFGTVVLALAIATVVLAFQIKGTSDKTEGIARDNAIGTKQNEAAVKVSCLRLRKFGPKLADAYLRFHILTPDEVGAYRATIPPAPC